MLFANGMPALSNQTEGEEAAEPEPVAQNGAHKKQCHHTLARTHTHDATQVLVSVNAADGANASTVAKQCQP